MVLYKHDLYLSKYGTVYYIKKIELKKKYYSVKLKYLLPDKIIPIIRKHHKKIVVSKSKKTIIFNSTKDEAIEIKTLVSLLDKSTLFKQVKITLISYQNDDLKKFGMNLLIKNNNSNTTEYKTLIDNLVLSQSLALNLSHFSLNFFISDLKTKSLVDLKFSPILSLFDNENTSFSITTKIPFLSINRSIDGTNDIQTNNYYYKDIGSSININKVAITDDEVYFHITMKYEVILEKTLTPTTAKKYIDNYIKLKDGQSMLIAGLTGTELRTFTREIPILASIPYIGNIFKYDSNSFKKETFAIFITSIKFKEEVQSDDACIF